MKYEPAERCLELTSFKRYVLEYRNLPIYQENVANNVSDALVDATAPVRAAVEGHC